MGKLIMFLIFIGLGILVAGSKLFPDNAAMWLASTTDQFNYLRLALMALLASLIVTRPPRNVYFRMFVGTISTFMGFWALHGLYVNQIMLLDALAVLGACISMGIVALEFEQEEFFENLAAQNRSAQTN